MRLSFRVALGCAAIATLAACGAPAPAPQDKYYRLAVEQPANPTAAPIFDGIIEVGRFIADGQVAGRPIIFVDPASPLQLNEHAYHFWNQPPAVMIQEQMISFLRAANASNTVVTPDMRVSPDMTLQGRILKLERMTGASPSAVLELELGLVKSPDDTLVFLDRYSVQLDAGGSTVADSVIALNDGLAVLFEQFLQDLRNI
ncbi:MAG: ABC-type transport auxiliary lipoprotein family protein [Magnetovibrionaceae bacterium]